MNTIENRVGIRIEDADAELTEQRARSLLPAANRRLDDSEWVAAARRGWDELPVGVRRPIRQFRRHSGSHGALLLRGVPVDDAALPQTPTVDGSVQRVATVPSAVLMMIACGLGDPAAFLAEKSGALVQDVVPVPGKEDFQGNAGSVLLSFHNENAFHEHRPDFVMLMCLRADHDGVAGLRTACIRDALPRLSPASVAVLSSTEFVTEPPPSFGSTGHQAEPAPVLFGDPEDPDVRVDLSATKAITGRAERALGELQSAFVDVAQTFRLAAGDLAVVDNRVSVHGRTAFRPRYDGMDRWLQRTFVLADLRRSRGLRPGDGYVMDR